MCITVIQCNGLESNKNIFRKNVRKSIFVKEKFYEKYKFGPKEISEKFLSSDNDFHF